MNYILTCICSSNNGSLPVQLLPASAFPSGQLVVQLECFISECSEQTEQLLFETCTQVTSLFEFPSRAKKQMKIYMYGILDVKCARPVIGVSHKKT
jgi:hypothetical protein